MPKTGIPISLERLKASLATAELEKKSIEGLKHDPPKIVVIEESSELLLYDGEPRTLAIQKTELRVRRELRVRGDQGQEERHVLPERRQDLVQREGSQGPVDARSPSRPPTSRS